MKISILNQAITWDWSPRDLETFLPGTEEWMIQLSRAFVRNGHDVTVYWDAKRDEEDQGVKYTNREQLPEQAEVLIYWNRPSGKYQEHRATKKLYWTNGSDTFADEYPDFYPLLNHVVAMGQYHKVELLGNVGRYFFEEVAVIPAGSEQPKSLGDITKRKNQMLYASSWDRGLSAVLQLWPYIWRNVPGSSLHVTYGREFAKKFGAIMAPLQDDLPGLVVHNQVNADEMEELFDTSEFLLYASREPRSMARSIYLTALKAQASLCLPMTTPHVAIDGQMFAGVSVPVGDLAERVIDIANNETEKRNRRLFMAAMMPPSWRSVAKQWEALFGD